MIDVNWLEAYQVLNALREGRLENNHGYSLGERADLFSGETAFSFCLAPEGLLFFALGDNVPTIDKLLDENYISCNQKQLVLTPRGFDTLETIKQYIKDRGEDSLSQLFFDEITWEVHSLYGS